jgi:hypothetical protein
VAKVDLADLLRVHCDVDGPGKRPKVISAWAVHYSRRRQLAAEVKARRAARRAQFGQSAFGMPRGRGGHYASTGYAAASTAEEADAERTVRLLSERATAARAEVVWANGAAEPQAPQTPVPQQPLHSTWSWQAIAAILVPALILLVVCLV